MIMKMTRLVFPGITMIAVTYGLARISNGLLLPNISHDLSMSSSISGIISAIFYLSYCFAIVLSTLLSVVKGSRNIILFVVGVGIAGLIIMGVSPYVWIMDFGL